MADESTTPTKAPVSQGTATTLGIERWVQFAFIGVALVAFWLLDNLIHDIWDAFREPNPTYVTGLAAAIAVIGTLFAYKKPKYYKFVTEVAVELSKVRWPNRIETRAHTVVVVIVSIIAAVILGVFDAFWSSVTDLIYDA